MFDNKNALSIIVRNIILSHFPYVDIEVIYDKKRDEYFISTNDKKLYYSEEYGMLIMEIKLNLLWGNGVFNFFFILDSNPIQAGKILNSISFSQNAVVSDFSWNIYKDSTLSTKDNVEPINLSLAA